MIILINNIGLKVNFSRRLVAAHYQVRVRQKLFSVAFLIEF